MSDQKSAIGAQTGAAPAIHSYGGAAHAADEKRRYKARLISDC